MDINKLINFKYLNISNLQQKINIKIIEWSLYLSKYDSIFSLDIIYISKYYPE